MKLHERIEKINDVATTDFARAQGMLDMLNDICGTQFGWLAKRVVIFENPNGSTAERYAHCHDAEMLYSEYVQ